jgi:hypothetical protein
VIPRLATIDDVLRSFYRSISFQPGAGPDLQTLRQIFHPQAKIIPPSEDAGGAIKPVGVDEFFSSFSEKLKDEGLDAIGASERELSRKTLVFHRIAQVLSSYHFTPFGSSEPIARGVNSLQLVFDADQWWIVSLTWDRAQAEELLTLQSLEMFATAEG